MMCTMYIVFKVSLLKAELYTFVLFVGTMVFRVVEENFGGYVFIPGLNTAITKYFKN